MSRTLYMQPREAEPLPLMLTHAEWCSWLSAHNSLAASHRACLHAERCVAVDGYAVHPQGSWERHRV